MFVQLVEHPADNLLAVDDEELSALSANQLLDTDWFKLDLNKFIPLVSWSQCNNNSSLLITLAIRHSVMFLWWSDTI